jgi:hypothetical protein
MKKKFNKEERNAIIKKLTKIAEERTDASWKKHREAYKPSSEYQRVKILLEQRNFACNELKELDSSIFNSNWDKFTVTNIQYYLDKIRDKEIKHLVERYKVNETDLEVEIILMDQDKPVDDLIERLLRNCLCD